MNQYSTYFFRQFFHEGLYAKTSSKTQTPLVKTPTLIIVYEIEYSDEKLQLLLKKILQAVQLLPKDYHILATSGEKVGNDLNKYQASKIISFGLLQEQMPIHEVSEENGTTWLCSYKLDELHKNTQHKKALWQQLKNLFL